MTTMEDTNVAVHYAPGDRPLCGNDSWTLVITDDPDQVKGCDGCLELVAEDLQDHHDYRGHCLHCRQEVSATGGVEWRQAVRRPCPHCGRRDW